MQSKHQRVDRIDQRGQPPGVRDRLTKPGYPLVAAADAAPAQETRRARSQGHRGTGEAAAPAVEAAAPAVDERTSAAKDAHPGDEAERRTQPAPEQLSTLLRGELDVAERREVVLKR